METRGHRRLWHGSLWACQCLLLPLAATAQQQPDLRQVIDRLDRLEAQNQELMKEIRALRNQLAATRETPDIPPEPIAEERAEIQERRIAELDQSKVGADHRLPITLSGTVLFNAFRNGTGSGGAQYPVVASTTRRASAGGSMRQTILGLKFDGPRLVGGGKMTGSVYMDFFGGGTGLDQTFRLRVARLDADWRNSSFTFAFDKPLIAQRDPDSLAQVGVSPLTGAGNLWLWQPQIRFEQRFRLPGQAGVRAQFSVYQTSEAGSGLGSEYGGTLAPARPGYQGRFEFYGQRGDTRRFEIAPGFHASSTRVLGLSVPSRIFTIDWLLRPASRIDFTGTFFQGENVGIIGGLRQGVNVVNRRPFAVEAVGGWAQVKVRLTPRLTLNTFGGQEDDRNAMLDPGAIAKNQSYGVNLMYRIGSNVMTGLEASQVRTTYLGTGTRINQHYDLAIAYLF
jgi:hypothetical protein